MLRILRASGSISVPVYPIEQTSHLTGFLRRWSSPSLQYTLNLQNLLWWIATILLQSHLCHPCMNFLHKIWVVWGTMRSHSTRISRTLFTLKNLVHHTTQCWRCNGFLEKERTQISTTCYKVSGDSSFKETICFLCPDFHILHCLLKSLLYCWQVTYFSAQRSQSQSDETRRKARILD